MIEVTAAIAKVDSVVSATTRLCPDVDDLAEPASEVDNGWGLFKGACVYH